MFQYTIQPGDTLYAISTRFYVPVAAILSANPGLDPYNLYIGQTILVPAAAYPVYPIPTPYGRYPQPGMPRVPGTPSMPRAPETPGMPRVPGMPSMPRVPGMPSMPRAPETPGTPGQRTP